MPQYILPHYNCNDIKCMCIPPLSSDFSFELWDTVAATSMLHFDATIKPKFNCEFVRYFSFRVFQGFFFYSVCMKCTLFSLHQSSIYSIVYHYNAYAEKKSQRDCIHFRKMTVDFHKTRLIRTNWPFLFGLFNAIKVRLNFIVHLHFPMLFAFNFFLCSLLKLSILICFKQFYHHANRMN